MATINAINSAFPFSVANGGTGLSSITAHGIMVGEGTNQVNPIVLTNGQLLIGSTGADPVAAVLTSTGGTLTYTTGPGSLNIDINGPVSVSNGGTGINSLTNHGIIIGQGTLAVTTATLTNGQLLIGSTGANPVAASLTAGTGITITPAAGSITIAATNQMPWVDQTATSVTMTSNTNYVADAGTLVTFTLPTTASFGDSFTITGKGTGGWKLAQNAGQTVYFGNANTTTGTGGSLASTLQRDTVRLVCVTANNDFNVITSIGNITYV